ncbi:hypothetical protein [Acanthopleuribacter pedis]|uniref:Uncharacterized protein n=1 Tax=Acanthopleuribacter pedis TaxID=442870 RepID=A0A8J7U3B8_9BACT|nr:hypothetical protein [Acanthopleuribacter pedis]MBO1317292.1 hypothetical protein [Acanthopleuribacter pedis]MBO1318599.1 hypothetical protein [Acanthopleuribacter pedis]
MHPLQACIAVPLNATLTSGSYTDVVEVNDYMVLATGNGLEIRFLDRSRTDLFTVPIPGEITQLIPQGNAVFVVTADVGMTRVPLDGDPANWSARAREILIPGIQSATVVGINVITRHADEVQLHEFRTLSDIDLLDTWPIAGHGILAFGNVVAVHTKENNVQWRYVENGRFAGPSFTLDVEGQTRFYGMELQNNVNPGHRLVVRAADRILWAGFDESGLAARTGEYFRNNARDLVFGWSVSDTHLFLRFADRLERRNIIPPDSPIQLPMAGTPLAEIGATRLRAVGDHVYFIYEGNDNVDWTLRSFEPLAGGLAPGHDLKSRYGAISSVAVASGHLFFASVNGLFSAGVAGDFVEQVTPREAQTFAGKIQSITGNGQVLYVVTSEPGASLSKLTVLLVDADGGISPVLEEAFTGAVERVSVYEDQLAILLVNRNYQGRNYTGYVIDQNDLINGSATFANAATFTELVSFDSEVSHRDFTLSQSGLIHHDGATVRLHPNLNNLNTRVMLDLNQTEPVQTVIVRNDQLWLQTASALHLYRLDGDQAQRIGSYNNWHSVSRLTGNEIIAQNTKDRSPGRYYTLEAAPNGLVQAVSSFRSSSPPLFADDTRDSEERRLFTVEASSLRSYRIECKDNTDRYLFPFSDKAELEVSTLLDSTDQINFTIFDREGNIIGYQRMDGDLISIFNGEPLEEWIYEYNERAEPYTVVLNSTRPIGPILSDQAGASPNSRYAYRIPSIDEFKTDIYMPHVPDPADWRTTLVLQNAQPGLDDLDVLNTKNETLTIELQNSSGERLSRQVPLGGTDRFDIGLDLFEKETSWTKISSFDLGTRLAGFGLIQRNNENRAAAIPLTNTLGEILVVPYIANGRDPEWFTGVVMSNPNPEEAVVRVFPYDAEGQILPAQTITIPGRSRRVDLAEDLYLVPEGSNEPVWMVVASSHPIMGMLLYGDFDDQSLAALPLSYFDGTELLISGIRQNDTYWSRISLTNIDITDTTVFIRAIDDLGQEIASKTLFMPRRGHVEQPVNELFPNLTSQELATVRTIHVQNDLNNVYGVLFRGRYDSDSIEAASALHLNGN